MDHGSGHVVVDVFLGDRGPYLFQVDTYASIGACLDDDLARELALPVSGTTQNSDGHRTVERDLVDIPELRLGDAVFRDVRTLVDDYDWIGTRGGRRVRGLLGFPLFRDRLLTFDYPGSRLVLERGALEADDPDVVPYRATTGSPDVPLTIGDRSIHAGVDTGHGGALIVPRSLGDELTFASELRPVGTARTAYGTREILGAPLAEPLVLARARFLDVPVHVWSGGERALLGHGLLSGLVVTFDQTRRLARFVASSADGEATERR